MNVTYQVYAVLYELGKLRPGGREFLDRYSSCQQSNGTIFSFKDEQTAMLAVTLAKKLGHETQLFYLFDLAPEEVSTHPGFYVSLKIGKQVIRKGKLRDDRLKKVDVAEDIETDDILLDERAQRFFDRCAVEVHTKLVGQAAGRDWYQVESLTELPDPIYIPHPIYFEPNVTPVGTYAVQSDGRDVLTDVNAAWLGGHGLVVSHEVNTPNRRARWRPRVLASGRVIDQFQKEGFRGLATPLVPLLPAHWRPCLI